MKNCITKLSAIFITGAMVFLGCQSPVNTNIKTEEPENRWLEEMTITKLQQDYREGKYTISDVVSAYLDRIIEIDKDGPALNSIIEINPDAMLIAAELDKEMNEGKRRGPLHGVPVILKDNIDTHDRMPTTAGATVLRNSFPSKDSFVAKKLGKQVR